MGSPFSNTDTPSSAGEGGIVAVTCANGLGHFRRVVSVIGRVLELQPSIPVDVICERWQIDRLVDWPPAMRLWGAGARAHVGVAHPGVIWSSDAGIYRDGRLVAWEQELAELPLIARARLVISDNLAGVLSIRPDAVLLGSFLWSEVLGAAFPAEPSVVRFCDHEIELLRRHRPPMLAVADLATPGVRQRTSIVELPWMCDPVTPPDPPDQSSARTHVAILPSDTSGVGVALATVARALAASPRLELTLPRSLRSAVPGARTFDFSPDAFSNCAAVVCRPGAGAVTECVTHRVPMVLAYEPNLEMAHNAARLAALGVAIDPGPGASPEVLVSATESLLDPRLGSQVRQNFAGLPRGGIDAAARWILNHLDRSGH